MKILFVKGASKYAFLIFTSEDLIDFKKLVFNTEAHHLK